MTTQNTGGPAFPFIDSASPQEHPGMTLRDYFAAKASEEDIKFYLPKGFNKTEIRTAPDGKKYEISVAATWTREQAKYRYADAMLKARNQ